MLDVDVIEDPGTAAVALEPTRSRILAALAKPASAASLASELGLPRQKINYHLRALEAHGLAKVVEERQWGGLKERLLVSTASSYVVSPNALGEVGADPERSNDRLSATYLLALAARIIRELSALLRRSRETQKGLATLAIDTEVRFSSAASRAAFTGELTQAITSLVARYHDAEAPGGRPHRLVLVAHPVPRSTSTKEES